MAHKKSTALAVLSFQLTPGSSGAVQLTPAGPAFRSADGSGRPVDVAAWRIDADIAARVIARHAAHVNQLVIDYEHQTLLSEKNGQPAPAAGWFSGVEWREGQGLFAAVVEWTDKAAAMIQAGEYRYISPVFEYDRTTGEVLFVRMAALVNAPGLDGMSAVALSAALADYPTPDFQPEEDLMNETLKKLLAAIGLPADALEADALTAVAAMKAKADEAEANAAALVALKAQAPQAPDPAKFVPIHAVQELQTQIAVLSAGFAKSEADKLIESALGDGRLNPALKGWAEDLGKSNLAALKAYVAAAEPVAALKGMQTNGQQPGGAGSAAAAGDAEVAVMKQLGLSAEEFSKGKV